MLYFTPILEHVKIVEKLWAEIVNLLFNSLKPKASVILLFCSKTLIFVRDNLHTKCLTILAKHSSRERSRSAVSVGIIGKALIMVRIDRTL